MTPAVSPLRAEVSALVRLAVPLAIAQGGQALMGVVDTAVVGRAGPLPLAGVGLGNVLFMALSVLGMGVMQGLDPLIAQALGAGDPARARRLLWQGTWLALALSAALAVPFLLAPAALEPLGIDADVAREGGRYLVWRLPGLPFFLLYFSGRAYLQAHGVVRPMVVATVLANLLNVPADVLLVFGGAGLPAVAGPLRAIPPLGAAGAAIATSLCAVAQAALLALAVRGVPRPPGRVARAPDGPALRAALAVGLPVGLHMGAEVGIFALVGFLAGRFGALPLAAHQLAISIASLTFTVAIGFGNAGSVRVGWAVGRRDRAGARRAGLAAFGSGAAFMSLSGLVFFLFPGPIARAMTDDPALVAAAVPLLRIAALFQLSDGIQGVGAGVLRGAGETRFAFAANLVGHWALGFPATVLLGFTLGLGVTGLWWGFVLGLTAVAVGLYARFLRVSAREIVPLADRAAVEAG
ncbi:MULTISPECIES: MATE family efflux transporter [unclassified Anaeromyxobacter]|uniref:MATE family efflux transporter n=1 Tax=unclassified Anaeromyxobacter TaxID=2620896 RepID=UPI001F5AF470|nr:MULTISPECIES: MATE family efflux transporter [unclassified Anaeromyxobacter]